MATDDAVLSPREMRAAVELRRALREMSREYPPTVDPAAWIEQAPRSRRRGLSRPVGLAAALAVAFAGLVAVTVRPDDAELHRLRPGVHAVLDERPDDTGGRLRPERPRFGFLGPRREPEQLLLDDVGRLADPSLEHGRLLEERDLHLAVAIPGGQRTGNALEAAQAGASLGQEVSCSPWGSK
jgi:hypothetical protein